MSFLLTPQHISRRGPGPFEATGGNFTETYISGGINYKSHTFTTGGPFTVISDAGIVDVMIVSGGGGGGNSSLAEGGTVAAGAGAGGMVVQTGRSATTGTHNFAVGGG